MTEPSSVPPEVRELLVCPVCKGDLADEPGFLVCPHDALAYPVVDGVPHMLPARAEKRAERR